MLREKNEGGLYVTVPSLFRCPISMDVMKSPVILYTGVTYDRSSIQTWLSYGHNTCPATMQVLHSTDFIPNLTLRHLIHHWSTTSSATSPHLPPPLSKQQAEDLIKSQNYSLSLSKILHFINFSDENRELIANLNEFVPNTISLLRNSKTEVEKLELIIRILDLIIPKGELKEKLNRSILKTDPDCLTPFITLLQKGSVKSKIQSARVLEFIACDTDSQRKISEKQGLVYELYRLIDSEPDRTGVEPGLSTLIAISNSRPAKKELVRFGIIRTVGEIINSGSCKVSEEKAMKVLEMVATCTEGRTAIGEDEKCVGGIVRRLMKCSGATTEHGITVLWSVCCLARDKIAREVVMRSNGLTKVLLVMQSGCSGSVRQMCGDLVKVLRVNNSKSCWAGYDTNTTHVMPY